LVGIELAENSYYFTRALILPHLLAVHRSLLVPVYGTASSENKKVFRSDLYTLLFGLMGIGYELTSFLSLVDKRLMSYETTQDLLIPLRILCRGLFSPTFMLAVSAVMARVASFIF